MSRTGSSSMPGKGGSAHLGCLIGSAKTTWLARGRVIASLMWSMSRPPGASRPGERYEGGVNKIGDKIRGG